ncbi:hypothetical protein N7452_002847 [Penicillium brevicompactum]|uniref:Uncharacterized protein n=1 Tax=Penicillium brevicompactum TaxID=5074 RepID=A0A9W9UK56_PENBR|nr:hypothetical protein N7452_002847 [Penicillium brevicompactum]
MTPTPFEEYAALMNRNGDGYYLYKPQPYAEIHPGVIGFFDRHGGWTTITDLSIPGRVEKDGYTSLGVAWDSHDPSEADWNTRASSSEAEHSFGVNGGLSGALSAAPVDVSAEAKNKWGQTGKAALIAEHAVINEKFRGAWNTPITNWVKANAKALVNSAWKGDIKEHGLWAVNKTWSTQECKITMDSAHHRDTSAGFKAGATGIAEGGLEGSSAVKGDSSGWTTFKASENDKGLVVSYGGNGFRLSSFTKLFTKALLKQTQSRAAPAAEEMRPVFDENGVQIALVRFRAVYDENGVETGWERVDEEAEKRKKEEADRKLIEDGDAEEAVEIELGDSIGQTEEDLEAEKQAEAQKATDRKELDERIAAVMAQDLPAEEKSLALQKLFTTTEISIS